MIEGLAHVGVAVKDIDGHQVADKTYPAVELAAGRTVTNLDTWSPAIRRDGHYAIEYSVETATR